MNNFSDANHIRNTRATAWCSVCQMLLPLKWVMQSGSLPVPGSVDGQAVRELAPRGLTSPVLLIRLEAECFSVSPPYNLPVLIPPLPLPSCSLLVLRVDLVNCFVSHPSRLTVQAGLEKGNDPTVARPQFCALGEERKEEKACLSNFRNVQNQKAKVSTARWGWKDPRRL